MTKTYPKIRIRNLSKSFGSNHVLRNINMDVMEGTSFVIIGGSGSGKSVLLRCILGLMTPDSGTIEIDGKNIFELPYSEQAEKLQEMGMLFQNSALFDIGDLYPSELSGGMQKRVGLARAIASKPEIIFFDEPTTGLDPIMGAIIDNLIVDCVKKLGSTTIAITHDMASAQRIGDQVAMLYKGELIWQGEAGKLMQSENPYVHQFTHGLYAGPIKMEMKV